MFWKNLDCFPTKDFWLWPQRVQEVWFLRKNLQTFRLLNPETGTRSMVYKRIWFSRKTTLIFFFSFVVWIFFICIGTNFRYSEKATQFKVTLHWNLTLPIYLMSKLSWRYIRIFVAVSENLNFIKIVSLLHNQKGKLLNGNLQRHLISFSNSKQKMFFNDMILRFIKLLVNDVYCLYFFESIKLNRQFQFSCIEMWKKWSYFNMIY